MKYRFLPEDYESPTGNSNYMKLITGENRVRILSEPVLGWEDWHEKKPVRYRFDDKPINSFDPKRPIKHFWSMVVWNYSMSSIQILHITQASIRKAIETLCQDPDWGAPYAYDIKIYKTGEGVDTEYSVNPISPKPVAEEVKLSFHLKPIFLEALFDGGDPFSPSNTSKMAQGMFMDGEVATGTDRQRKAPQNASFEALDLELFMDFLPDSLDVSRVAEFVGKCAEKADKTQEEYCAESTKNIQHFINCYTKWLALPQKAKASA